MSHELWVMSHESCLTETFPVRHTQSDMITLCDIWRWSDMTHLTCDIVHRQWPSETWSPCETWVMSHESWVMSHTFLVRHTQWDMITLCDMSPARAHPVRCHRMWMSHVSLSSCEWVMFHYHLACEWVMSHYHLTGCARAHDVMSLRTSHVARVYEWGMSHTRTSHVARDIMPHGLCACGAVAGNIWRWALHR